MRAILLATTSGAEARAGTETVVERLIRQFAAHNVTDITVITRARYRSAIPGNVTIVDSSGVREDLRLLTGIAAHHDGPLLLACADAMLADTAVSAVLSDPTQRCGALVSDYDASRPLDPPLRRERGMIVSVGTGYHRVTDANAMASGLIKISAPYLDDLCQALHDLAADGVADFASSADSLTLTLLALTRRGTKLTAYEVPGIQYGRVAGNATAQRLLQAITAVDEDAVRLDLCVKKDDDLFATYCISSYSRHLVRWCAKLKLTPVAVTWVSILLALGAAGLFATATRPALIAGAVLMYGSFVLDCVDGQLARYRHHFSAFGGWLDMIADRSKEYLMYGGLAWGAASMGLTWAWPLAITAITVQTVRHMTDTWYGTLQDAATLRITVQPLSVAEDRFAPSGSASDAKSGSVVVRVGKTLGKLSAQFTAKRRSPAYWFKRTIVFPVGERWLVMGVCAAVFDGRVALAALLTWQLVAFAYTLAGRTLRSLAARVAVLARKDVSTHRDDGFLSRYIDNGRVPALLVLGPVLALILASIFVIVTVPAVASWAAAVACVASLSLVFTAHGKHDGYLDWWVPAGMRAVECGLIIACGLASQVPPALVFALLAVLMLYHYDLAARIDKAASPLSSRAWGLGWDGRVVVLLLSLLPWIGTIVFALLTAHMAVVFLGGALLGRRTPQAAKPDSRTPQLSSTAH